MKKTFIAGLVLGAAAQVTVAQEAKTEPRVPKIAIIDMARVSSESLMGKGYATQLEALQIRCGSDAASGPVEQVERLVEDVIPGHARELPAGDDPRDDLARRLLESGAARGAGIVEQQEASVAEVAPQLGDLAVGGCGDRLIAGENRERIAEEVRVGERDRLHHRGGLDARALGDLPGEAREPVRPGIPTACVADLGEGDAGGVAKSENAAGRESGN